MTRGATFAERGMFEDVRFGLFAVTIGTRFVHTRHGEAAVWFHDVGAVRVVALNAVHFAFEDRVMLRQVELGVRGNVALETGFGLFAGIDDEFAATDSDVFAARSMTRFAALLAGHLRIGHPDARVWARWKNACDFVVAIGARFVADVSCAFDLRRSDDGASIETCAGVEDDSRSRCDDQQEQGDDNALHWDLPLWVWLTRDAVESERRNDGVVEQRWIDGSGVSGI